MRWLGVNGAVASYGYDAFGRRIAATRAAVSSGTATAFLYQGDNVVQENQGGVAVANVFNALGTDERLSRSGVTYLTDLLGSTVAMAAGTAVQTSYGYDPYGVASATGTATTNTFQYTGRENDGAGLMFYRARYYNPGWGRFVSEDPIGVAGGVNL